MGLWHALRLLVRALGEKGVLRRSPEKILALQQERLRAMVAWAKTHSPYHRERLKHIDPRRFDLRELPTLTKAEMVQNFDDLVTDPRITRAGVEQFMSDPDRLGQWYLGEYALSRTSGTQGLQAYIVQTRRMMELLFAIQMTRGTALPTSAWGILQRVFVRARLGVVTIGRGFFPSAAALAYAPPGYSFFVKRKWIPTIEPLEDVVAQLNEFRPDVLLAYANVLEMLAREALAGRLHIQRGLRQVINMSEPLSDGARNLTEGAFGVKITNNYAMGECMATSTGCVQGHGMHLQADWAVLEVVDRHNRPVPPGQPGDKVLLTNLYNTVQPFIRYEIGDVVTMSPKPCPCGAPLPLILRVEGRTDDVVWIRIGDRYQQVHPYVFVDCLDEYPAVGWYQVVQTERNRFTLRAVPAPGRQVSVGELQDVVRRGLEFFHLAEHLQVEIEITDNVAPDPNSGKLRRIMSLIGPPPEVTANGAAANGVRYVQVERPKVEAG